MGLHNRFVMFIRPGQVLVKRTWCVHLAPGNKMLCCYPFERVFSVREPPSVITPSNGWPHHPSDKRLRAVDTVGTWKNLEVDTIGASTAIRTGT